MRYSKAPIIIAFLCLLVATAAYAQLTTTGIGKVAGGGGPPPTCNGTIDLSTGCVQPMLGGL